MRRAPPRKNNHHRGAPEPRGGKFTFAPGKVCCCGDAARLQVAAFDAMRQGIWTTLFFAAAAAARAGDVGGCTNAAAAPSAPTGVDAWQKRIEQSIESSVEYFDRFFGEERLKDDNRSTRVQFRLGLKVDRLDRFTLKQDLSARLALPRMQNRVQVFFDDLFDVDRPFERDAIETQVRESESDTGLRYVLKEDARFRVNTDAGLRLGSEPQAFGRVRGRYIIPRDEWELRFTQRLFWFTRDGFGEDSAMDWSRQLADGALFRSQSVVGWTEDRPGVMPRQVFSYYRVINPRSSWRTSLRAEWPESPGGDYAIYGEEVTYRRLIYSDWLFAEITPGLEWVSESSFGWNPFVFFMFEVNFEKADRPMR